MYTENPTLHRTSVYTRDVRQDIASFISRLAYARIFFNFLYHSLSCCRFMFCFFFFFTPPHRDSRASTLRFDCSTSISLLLFFTDWNSALFIILNGTKEEHLDMLDGGIIQRLLEEKWKTFARVRLIFISVCFLFSLFFFFFASD